METPKPQQSARSGDPAAFNRLYAAFAPRVLAYLLRLTGGSRAEAEDLTQETFLAAYSGSAGMQGAKPLAWLFGIARRRQRDAFRAATVRPQTAPIDHAENAPGADTTDETVSQRVVLENALDKLGDAEREAILLVVVQGLTYVEAATILEEPVGTVKWRVHEGTKRLRGQLADTFLPDYAPREKKGRNHVIAL